MGVQIRKGDTVEVISGDDRGMRGKVLRVLPKKEHVVVAGVNMVKRHQRPVRAGRGQVSAGIIEFEAPIHVSNVMLVCPHCGDRTRVRFDVQGDGSKARVCKECNRPID